MDGIFTRQGELARKLGIRKSSQESNKRVTSFFALPAIFTVEICSLSVSYPQFSVKNKGLRIGVGLRLGKTVRVPTESKLTSLIIVMGVSGSGKTLVGRHLAQQLGIEFVDGDDLHSRENVQRMNSGIKLDDEARSPWLMSICDCAESHFTAGRSVVIACSALKSNYRDQLRTISRPTIFVHLSGPLEVIKQRLEKRADHFMPAALLESQFAELENPIGEPNIVPINIDQSPESMLEEAHNKTREKLKQIAIHVPVSRDSRESTE